MGSKSFYIKKIRQYPIVVFFSGKNPRVFICLNWLSTLWMMRWMKLSYLDFLFVMYLNWSMKIHSIFCRRRTSKTSRKRSIGTWMASYFETGQYLDRQTMHFHTFLDGEGDWLDTIFFPDTSRYYPVTGKGCYAMKGKVVEEFGVYSVEVKECRKIGLRERDGLPNILNRPDSFAAGRKSMVAK